MIVGTSFYSPARTEKLSNGAAEAEAAEGASRQLKAQFGLMLGPSAPPMPPGALVVDTTVAGIAIDDIICAVNGVPKVDVAAVQAALLGTASGASAQVCVRTPESLESAYDVLDLLGQGKQGTVHRARSKRDGAEVAVKTVKTTVAVKGFASKAILRQLQKYHSDLLRREVELLRLMTHPNASGLQGTFERPGELQLILDLCRGGDLERVLVARGALREEEARHVLKQLCEVLAFMHARHIIHRDVKPANVMIVDGPGPDAFLTDNSLLPPTRCSAVMGLEPPDSPIGGAAALPLTLFLWNDRSVKLVDFGIGRLVEPPRKRTLVPRPKLKHIRRISSGQSPRKLSSLASVRRPRRSTMLSMVSFSAGGGSNRLGTPVLAPPGTAHDERPRPRVAAQDLPPPSARQPSTQPPSHEPSAASPLRTSPASSTRSATAGSPPATSVARRR